MKFICKKVKKIRWYHDKISQLMKFLFNIEIFFCTLEELEKEIKKKKKLIKNIKKLTKEVNPNIKEKFKKGFGLIKDWEEEVKIIQSNSLSTS